MFDVRECLKGSSNCVLWSSTLLHSCRHRPNAQEADIRRLESGIQERDGTCVVTGESAEDCDASHCLPHAKGDELRSYIGVQTLYLLTSSHISPVYQRSQHLEVIHPDIINDISRRS
jgi:hypothetical protein